MEDPSPEGDREPALVSVGAGAPPSIMSVHGPAGSDFIEIDHWVYGVIPGVGYTTKAASRGLNVTLYDAALARHYTPIRPAATQAGSGTVSLVMIHPVISGQEMLLSRIGPGPIDEAGRPTFVNHSAVVPVDGLRSGQISLEAVLQALEGLQSSLGATGDLELLRVPARTVPATGPALGAGIHRYLSFPALETLATRLMDDPRSRTLILCRNSSPEGRNKTLFLVVELLNWACGLPGFAAITDAPPTSSMNFFNLVVAPRGVRADSTWALLESTLAEVRLPRTPGRDSVYDTISSAYYQSKTLRLAR